MEARDRRASLGLFALAAAAWLVVGVVLLTQDPNADVGIRYAGAGLIGLAAGLTAGPLFWLAGFARQRRISFRGDWQRAARRGAWVGGVVGLIVLLRVEGLFQPQVGLFVIALAIVAEVSLSTRR
jgi:hypothetical protein